MLNRNVSFYFVVKSQSSTNVLSWVPQRRRRRYEALELSGVLGYAFSGKEFIPLVLSFDVEKRNIYIQDFIRSLWYSTWLQHSFHIISLQRAIDEVDYAVKNIAIDLRDGLRLTWVPTSTILTL